MKKKLLAAGMACAIVFSLSATAFAHHGYRYANCPTSGCTTSGAHYHDGVCYSGAYSGARRHHGGCHR